MISKHDVMRYAGAAADKTRVAALATSKYGGAGAIFTLHSVVADDDYLPRENLHTSAGFLERMVRHYVDRRVPILSLSDAMARLESGSTERFVCFTFDDGYRDNLTRALPIFRKYGQPFTIYVTSSYLDRRYDDYWWGQLRHVVRENEAIDDAYLGKPIAMRTRAEKSAAYRTIAKAIWSGALAGERQAALFDRYHMPAAEALDRDAMTEAELRSAAESEPLLEIGGHTDSHGRLAKLDEAAAFADISRNKAHLEAIVGREVRHFAYPFGDRQSCGLRDFALAERAGYRTATTTRIGNLFPAHLEHRWALPRLRFLGPCESVGFMESQRAGAVGALVARFGDPVATV